jgi:peptidyl-dipeptidase Dcp
MRKTTFALAALAAGLVPALRAADVVAPVDNPLLLESPLPFHYPQFDKIKPEHFEPAFTLGMAEQLKEVDAIANNPDAPTFDNTIVAYERSGETLGRATTVFFNLTGANTNPELDKIDRAMAPKFAAHRDAIYLNPALFARVEKLYNTRDSLHLDPESAYLLERYYKDFIRAGAKLDATQKNRLKAINGELATIRAQFSQKVLKEINASDTFVDTREELAGLSDAEITAAADLATKDGQTGKFALRLTNTTGQAQLTELENRAVRERFMAASLSRNSRGDEFDTRELIVKTVRLRAERAALLGYDTFAAYQLEDQTAHNVDTVNKLLAQLAKPAVANARREAADMQALVDAAHGGFTVDASDWAFYAEKVRRERYAFDESQLKPYFELNHVLLDGVFYAANRMYGLTFKERHDLPVYEPTVRVFDVFDRDGTQLAIFIGDYYARPSKRGGAWMNSYVSQSDLLGLHPVVANHLNIPRPPEGQPTLLTPDEVRTAFHEFGHALHGMFSKVKYPRFSGTSVPRDFVEYPSQVNEMWATWPEVLQHYAKHYQTGAPIPQALIDKMLAAKKFNQGYSTTELVAANLIDQAWHQLKPDQVPNADGVLAFETAALQKAGADFGPVPPRYRGPYYSHIFTSGYSAGYYSYFWSEVLDADTVEWIKQHGGLKRENGDRFRAKLLSRGGSADALGLFHDFTGRDPYIDPLLERRGLTAQ